MGWEWLLRRRGQLLLFPAAYDMHHHIMGQYDARRQGCHRVDASQSGKMSSTQEEPPKSGRIIKLMRN
eukprot:1156280-Pelagomonas_calceolata.AAC.4